MCAFYEAVDYPRRPYRVHFVKGVTLVDVVGQYYCLSEILDDDVYKVAHVIQSASEKKMYLTYVVSELEAGRVDKFAEVIDIVLSWPSDDIIESAKGLVFADLGQYVSYLCGLLDSNNIPYAHFKIKPNTGGAKVAKSKMIGASYIPEALRDCNKIPKPLF